MTELGTVRGWTVFEADDRLYIRLEQVVKSRMGTSDAEALLDFALRYDGVGDVKTDD